MKTLNAALILEKNKLYSSAPWIHLFNIVIDSTTTIYRAAYPDDVVWNGNTYTATPMWLDSESQQSSGRLSDLTVYIANVDQLVSSYVENNDILGNDVTLYIVHASDLTITTSILSSTYRINQIETTEEVAAFQLGHDDLFALQLPHQRYIRDKCRFVYGPTHRDGGGSAAEDYCGYPGDEFEGPSKQVFSVGGDGARGGGWTVVNTANAGSFDISNNLAGTKGRFRIYADSGGPFDWNDTTRDAPHAYKTFTGDFDAYVRYTGSADTNGGFGFCVQSSTDLDDWVAMMAVYSGGQAKIYVRNTVNGVSTDTDYGNAARDWRIKRAGSIFTFYEKTTYVETWSEQGTQTRDDFPNAIRLVLFANSITANEKGVSWHFLRFYSGGLSSCDYTLDGPNGCRIHENTTNFGGFPAIPAGRINV